MSTYSAQTGASAADALPRLLSMKEVCRILGVERQTIDRYVRNGELAIIRIGGTIRIEQSVVEDLIQRGREAGAAS